MSSDAPMAQKAGLFSFISSGNTITMLLVLATVCSMYYMHTEMCRLEDRLTYTVSQKNTDTELLKLLSEINHARDVKGAAPAETPPEREAAAPATSDVIIEDVIER